MSKKPLEPLIPLEQFGKLVAQIAKVPKDAVIERDSAKQKRQRKAQPKKKRD